MELYKLTLGLSLLLWVSWGSPTTKCSMSQVWIMESSFMKNESLLCLIWRNYLFVTGRSSLMFTGKYSAISGFAPISITVVVWDTRCGRDISFPTHGKERILFP